jgi:hypothetical protein
MIKQPGKVLLITVFFLFYTGINVFAQTHKSTVLDKVEYLYPANKEKIFNETVDQFYEALRKRSYPVHQEFFIKHLEFYKRNKHLKSHMDIALFKEIPHASINIREKVMFNEVEKFNYINWDGIINTSYPNIDIQYHQTISPHRQVYFFFSLKDTEKVFYGRYAVYDVETKKMLAGGDSHIDKYLKPKKVKMDNSN